MLTSGQLLADRYRLGRRIAVGGMGEVWEAVDVRLDRTVAIKVLKPELCGDAEFLHRFRTEARTTASLNHPGIAAVHDYGETAAVPDGPEDTAYLVMELVEGEPLAAVLAREGRIAVEHVVDMLEQAGNALQAAHERGLVHRDIKPGNILITPSGTVKLTDFGIAKAADAAPVTRSGMVMGTAHYIAPEQALGSDAMPASDVYSLAVVGYECLKGHRPFLSENAVTVAMMHIREVPPPLPPDVPPGVRALIEATLVKDPRRRYAGGGEFAKAVAAVRAGLPLPAPAALAVPPQQQPLPRNVGAPGGVPPLHVGQPSAPVPPAGTRPPGAMPAPPVPPPQGPPTAGVPVPQAPQRSRTGLWVALVLVGVVVLVLLGWLVWYSAGGAAAAQVVLAAGLRNRCRAVVAPAGPVPASGTMGDVRAGAHGCAGEPPLLDSPGRIRQTALRHSGRDHARRESAGDRGCGTVAAGVRNRSSRRADQDRDRRSEAPRRSAAPHGGHRRTAGRHDGTIIDEDRDDASMSSPRLLSNRYEIGDTLGYGGMSEVHRGRDIRLGRDVAVKVLRADLARDPTFQLRFRREAQNAAALNHPAIVAVYDTGETESENGPLPYIVMEYVDGRTLRDIVKSEGPLAPRRAMEVMADASAALDFSHRHGIVHRDVKPANIMITRSGAVKVMDFGIARALADGQAAVTQTAAVIGTAQYLSPEQARGESVDARSDVYAAGCVLFELLTSEPPFTGDSPVAVAYQHVREDPRKPSDVNQTVPASLDAVVLKALSKNPANRYQSAAEMRADLVRVLSGQRPKAPMVMSEEERTAMMAPSSPATTEVFTPGRHRSDGGRPTGTTAVVEEPDNSRSRRNWTIGLVTLACVVVFALVAWLATALFSKPEQPQQVAVPSVQGMTMPSARQLLNSQNWLFNVKDCESAPEAVDTVINQTPAAGTEVVKSNTRITLCQGIGPGMVQVPNLYGKDKSEAAQLLEQAGLTIGLDDKEVEVEDPSMVGKILDWDSRGKQVAKGTTINVTVGKEIPKVQVPSVVNLPYAQAKQTLETAGFKVTRQDQESDQPADQVIAQNPSGGSQVKSGAEITLTVSKGSQQLTMPDLTGKSKDEAEAALQAMGWSGSISEQSTPTSDMTKDGKVVGSSPSSGQQISKNQSITLLIGEYDSDASETSPPTTGGLFSPFG